MGLNYTPEAEQRIERLKEIFSDADAKEKIWGEKLDRMSGFDSFFKNERNGKQCFRRRNSSGVNGQKAAFK